MPRGSKRAARDLAKCKASQAKSSQPTRDLVAQIRKRREKIRRRVGILSDSAFLISDDWNRSRSFVVGDFSGLHRETEPLPVFPPDGSISPAVPAPPEQKKDKHMLVPSSLLLIVVAMFMGCVDLKHAENADLQQVKEYVNGSMGHYSTRFSGIFYVGSDNEFDYVAIKYVALKYSKNTVKVFKIKRGELGIKHQMKIDANNKKWVDITGMFPLPQ